MEVTCESRITQVVVYEDRARVTREAEVPIRDGTTVVAFDDLPEQVDSRSVRLSGGEGLVLRDIRVEMIVLGAPSEVEKRALAEELQRLEDADRELADRERQLSGEKTFVERIAARLTGDQGKPGSAEFSPENWVKMVDFYRERMQAIDSGLRGLAAERRESKKALEDARVRLDLAGGRGSRVRTRVSARVVRVDDSAGSASLALEYVVNGPNWEPTYDVRAFPERDELSITYGAIVSQNSGEDWMGVRLSLSTAPVHSGGDAPEVQPRYVSLWVPPPPPIMRKSGASAAGIGRFDVEEAAMQAAMAPAPECEPVAKKKAVAIEAAEVRSGAVSAEFVVAGGVDIPSGGAPANVTIAEFPLPAEFSRVAVPSMEERVYLSAKAKNASEYPMLAGRAFVFLEGAFVAESSLDFTPVGAEFDVSLGVDASVSIEYRVVRDFGSVGGFVAKREKVAFERLIVIENRSRKPVRLKVEDSVPIPGNQDIIVKLEEPAYRKDTPELSQDERGILAWRLEVAAGQKLQLPFKYSVEKPQGARLEWR